MGKGTEPSNIRVGEFHRQQIRIAALPGGSTLSITALVLKGARPGPRLTIVAGQHGNELPPLKVVQQLLTRLRAEEVAGTVTIIPVANPLALATYSRGTYVDGVYGDGGNLNRLWPGRPGGFITGRIADAIWNEFILGSDYVIDMHDGTPTLSLYYTYVNKSARQPAESRANELARSFGMELLVELPPTPGSLSTTCIEADIPAITCEIGNFSGLELDDGTRTPPRDAIDVGVGGVENVMREVGMLEGHPYSPVAQLLVGAETAIGPNEGGLLESTVGWQDIGRRVVKGAVLGQIVHPSTFEILDTLTVPFDDAILLAVTSTNPFVVVNAGGGDFGYFVADRSRAVRIGE